MNISKELTVHQAHALKQAAQVEQARAGDEFEATHGSGVVEGIDRVITMLERQNEITD